MVFHRHDSAGVATLIFGIRPICRLHFGPKIQNFPSFIVKNGPEKGTQKRAKHAIFVFLKSSSFPPKRAKKVVSTRKSRQQTGLKAIRPSPCLPVPPNLLSFGACIMTGVPPRYDSKAYKPLSSWENPAPLKSPKPRRVKSNSKVTQKWVSGSPPM